MKLLGAIFVFLFALPLYFMISMGWTGGAIVYSVLLVAIYAALKQIGDGIVKQLPPAETSTPATGQQTRAVSRAATLAAMRKR